jgi:hypothetical protein
MSYCFPVRCVDPPDFAEYQGWFRRSMSAVMDAYLPGSFASYRAAYEAKYGVKVVTNSFGTIEQVEFPSRKAAMLFLLRWT